MSSVLWRGQVGQQQISNSWIPWIVNKRQGYIYKGWKRKIPVNISNWTRKSPRGLNPTQRSLATGESWKYERWTNPRKRTTVGLWSAMVISENIHTGNIVDSELVLFRNVKIYGNNQWKKRPWVWRRAKRDWWKVWEKNVKGGGDVPIIL